MSALDFRPIKKGSECGGPCANRCLGTFADGTHGRASARWRLALVGHPAGLYCDSCKTRMGEAWGSALTTEREAAAA